MLLPESSQWRIPIRVWSHASLDYNESLKWKRKIPRQTELFESSDVMQTNSFVCNHSNGSPQLFCMAYTRSHLYERKKFCFLMAIFETILKAWNDHLKCDWLKFLGKSPLGATWTMVSDSILSFATKVAWKIQSSFRPYTQRNALFFQSFSLGLCPSSWLSVCMNKNYDLIFALYEWKNG